MTIDTQSAAPQGAAPAFVAAGLGARSGDAPATKDLFASLVAQLAGGASVGRPSGARPAAPMDAPGDGQPFTARPARVGGRPAPNGGTPASVLDMPPDASSSDETGSAPIDPTLLVTEAEANPAIALPAWLWALSEPATPPAVDVTNAAGTGTADAARTDDEHAGTPSFVMAGRQTFIDALTPVALGRPDRRGEETSTSRAQPDEGDDEAARVGIRTFGVPAGPGNTLNTLNTGTTVRAGEAVDAAAAGDAADVNDSTDDDVADAPAPMHAASRSVGSAYTRRGASSVDALPLDAHRVASYRPAQTVDAAVTLAQAVAPDWFGSARPVDRIALDRANRAATLFNTSPPTATLANGSTGQPAPPVAADATSAQAVTPDWFGSARPVDRIALDRANGSGTLFNTPAPAAALANGSTGQPVPLAGGASPVPAQAVDADAPSSQAAAPDRFGSASLVDPIARDRANRARTPFSATTPTAALANESTGQPAPLAARDLANVAATDPATASESHQSPSGQSVSERASRDDARMLAGRAIDAAAAAPLHVEHGALDAARLLEVVGVGVGAAQTAAPATMLIPASADAPIAIPDERDLRHQIVQGIKFQWRDGAGDVQLTLHPEYLGEMRIALRVDQGGVTAQLSADSASVRAWAMANESLLRQGLAEQGLTLSRLVVTDEAPEFSPGRESRRRAPQQDTPEPPAPRRSDAAIFEIVL